MDNIPLISCYKRAFVARRLVATFTGGFRLQREVEPPEDYSLAGYVAQAVLLLYPLVVSVGITVPYTMDLLSKSSVLILAGMISALFTLAFHVVIKWLGSGQERDRYTKSADLLKDQEGLFTVAIHKCWVTVLLHSCLSGILQAAALNMVTPPNGLDDAILTRYPMTRDRAWRFSWFVFLLNGLSTCTAHYSLLIGPPPETATWRPTAEQVSLNSLNRPVQMILVGIVYGLVEASGWVPFGSFTPTDECSITLQSCLIAFQVGLPAMWVIGIIPPLEPLMLYATEQAKWLLFGGQPHPSLGRNLLLLITWLTTCSLTQHYLTASQPYIAQVVLSLVALWTALDFSAFHNSLTCQLAHYPKLKTDPAAADSKLHPQSLYHGGQPFPGYEPGQRSAEIVVLYGLTSLAVLVAVSVCHALHCDPFCAIIALIVTQCVGHVLAGLQQVYICGGLVRNPFYPELPATFSEENLTAYMRRLTRYNRPYKYLSLYIMPLLLHVYLCTIFQNWSADQPHNLQGLKKSSSLMTGTEIKLLNVTNSALQRQSLSGSDLRANLWDVIFIFRAFHTVWTEPDCLLAGIYLTKIYKVSTSALSPPSAAVHLLQTDHDHNQDLQPRGSTNMTHLPLVLCLASVMYRVVAIRMWRRGKAILLLAVSSVVLRKQRTPLCIVMNTINTMLFPILVLKLLLAAIFNTAILPLFTMPIFVFSFPRPAAFWPQVNSKPLPSTSARHFSSRVSPTQQTDTPARDPTPSTSAMSVSHKYNQQTDAVYYEQLIPQLADELGVQLGATHLSGLRPGDHLLARYADRLVMGQVLSNGHGHVTLGFKGLELQETSCHSIEATAVDEIIDETFTLGGGTKSAARDQYHLLNEYFYSTLSPLAPTLVTTYSDARASLNGVIDSPDIGRIVRYLFPSVFIWVLLRHRTSLGPEEVPKKTTSPPEDKDTEHQLNGCAQNGTVKTISNGKLRKPSFTLPGNKPLSPIPEVLSVCSSVNTDDQQQQDLDNEDPLGLGPLSGWILATGKLSKSRLSSGHLTYQFTDEWYHACVQDCLLGGRAPTDKRSRDQVKQLSDTHLEAYRRITSTCYSCLFPVMRLTSASSSASGPSLASRDVPLGAAELYDLFMEYSPYTTETVHHLGPDVSLDVYNHPDLRRLCTKAFRYCLVIAIEEVVHLVGDGPLDGLIGKELLERLHEFHTRWLIASDRDPAWASAVRDSTREHLFSISPCSPMSGTTASDGGPAYVSHRLTLLRQPVYVFTLNGCLVESIWSSLALELLYMTNDDEERYSIQAHPLLLRNLTVQAAEPPLGYPLYQSPVITINYL